MINNANAVKDAFTELADAYIFPYLKTLTTDFERKYTFTLLIDYLVDHENEDQRKENYQQLEKLYTSWSKNSTIKE